MSCKRVCIIGAGASGLTAIKCCLDENLQPVCFERDDNIGGLWNFKEQVPEGQASIYRSVIINTSKEMMCYSDFPIPASFPNFMHNSRIVEYFRMYAQQYQLEKYIRYKTSVKSLKRREDFDSSGQWDVTVVTEDGAEESSVFDAVMVCTGHHTDPHLPLDSFLGIEKFGGRYMHSKEYKDHKPFEGKRVMVVGVGNSGLDIAVELSRHASQVFLSTRRGAWVINRVAEGGKPLDIAYVRRSMAAFFSWLPTELTNRIVERQLNARFNHRDYGLQATHRYNGQHPSVNDDLPNRILSGTLTVKPNVASFTESGVVFEDGTREDIDSVIFATGYTFRYPFLDTGEPGLLPVKGNRVSLYKFAFPPRLARPTLVIVGLIQPLGAIMPISEMQCRWATRVFKGLVKLPSIADMMDDIRARKESMEKRYVASQRHTIQVEYIDYMDQIAQKIGVKPNFLPMFRQDPRLALKVFFGPCTPYQYRLVGPGCWPGAAEAIRTQWDRIVTPTRTRSVDSNNTELLRLLIKMFICLLVVVAVVVEFF